MRARGARPTSLGDDPQLVQVDGHPLGFVLVPFGDSPVRARIPSGSCRGVLPDPLPAGQLLVGCVDWDEILARDTLGTLRDDGLPVRHRRGAVGAGRWVAGAPCAGGRDDRGPGGPSPAGLAAARPRRTSPLAAAGTPGAQVCPARPPGCGASGRTTPRRFDQLLGCTDARRRRPGRRRRHRWGFLYDERDGTGLDRRPALVRAPARPRRRRAPAAVDVAALPERAAGPQRHRRRRPAGRSTPGTACAAGCTGWSGWRDGGSSGSTDASTRGSPACPGCR